jgi:uncharacterized membrane protein YeaQ/YmgE (transglycosylase-associated protein family)
VLGIIGAVVGGFLVGLFTNRPIGASNDINIASIVVAVVGAIIAVVVVGYLTGGRRVGRGPV